MTLVRDDLLSSGRMVAGHFEPVANQATNSIRYQRHIVVFLRPGTGPSKRPLPTIPVYQPGPSNQLYD